MKCGNLFKELDSNGNYCLFVWDEEGGNIYLSCPPDDEDSINQLKKSLIYVLEQLDTLPRHEVKKLKTFGGD